MNENNNNKKTYKKKYRKNIDSSEQQHIAV